MDNIDMKIIEAKADLMLIGMLAQAKRSECDAKLVKSVSEHDSSNVLVAGLCSESLRGYLAGIMTAIRVLNGEDALEFFREFSDGLDETSRKTLEFDFREQVEHYSETGED